MKKILVVDDSQIYRDTLKVLLEENGFEVISAQDGKEGLDKAHESNPNLIIIDVVMPNENGLALLEKLRKESTFKSTPIIVHTNLESGRELSTSLGANSFILKGNNYDEELLDSIKQLLSS